MVLALVVTGLLVSISAPGAVAVATQPGCPPQANVLTPDQAQTAAGSGCEMEGRTIAAGGVGIVVPAPGIGVSANAIQGDGYDEASLEVVNSGTGDIEIDTTGQVDAQASIGTAPERYLPQAATLATAARCNYASTFAESRWWSQLRTGFRLNNNDRRPSSVGETAWESLAKGAAGVWSNGSDSCGFSGTPDLTVTIYPDYSTDANISTSNTCLTRDSVNVIDFGSLTSTTLGLTCSWFQTQTGRDKMLEADTRLDSSGRTWVTSVDPVRCIGQVFDVRSVLTHELGHAIGLGHAREDGGNDQTMSPSTSGCNTSARLLGEGDFRSLLLLY